MVSTEYIPGLGLVGALPVNGIEETEAFHCLILDDEFGDHDINSTSHYTTHPFFHSKFDVESFTSSWLVFFKGSGDDRGHSIQVKSSGESVVTGEVDSGGAGDFDIFLSQLDKGGNASWKKVIGSTGYDKGRFVQVTSDDGVIVIGAVSVLGAGDKDCVVIKTNSSGGITWAYAFGTAETEEGNFIQESSGGNFTFTGYTGDVGADSTNDFFLIESSSQGEFLRGKVFDGTERDHARCKTTSDGGMICVSSTRSFTNGWYDLAFVRLDNDWNVFWQKLFSGSVDDYGFAVEETPDGGFVVAGLTGSFGAGELDGLLTKVDSDGELVLAMTIGSSGHELIYFMKKTSDGNFVVVGWTTSFGTDGKKVFFAKIRDTEVYTDVLIWAKVLRGISGGEGWFVDETEDGEIVLAGFADGGGGDDIFVAKVYADGTVDDCSIIEDVTHLVTVTDVKGSIDEYDISFTITDFNPTRTDIKDLLSVDEIDLTREVVCQYITSTPLYVTPTAPRVTPTALVVTPSAMHATPTPRAMTPSAMYATPTPVHTPTALYVTPTGRHATPILAHTPTARFPTPTPAYTPTAPYPTPTLLNIPPFVVMPIPDQFLIEGKTFQFGEETFRDGNNDHLKYSATLASDDPLPNWITFDPITRTFTFDLEEMDQDEVVVSIKVTADDGRGGIVSNVFDITLLKPNSTPTYTFKYGDVRIWRPFVLGAISFCCCVFMLGGMAAYSRKHRQRLLYRRTRPV